MTKKEIIDFLVQHLRIHVEPSDRYIDRPAVRVRLSLSVDGEEIYIDSDTMDI